MAEISYLPCKISQIQDKADRLSKKIQEAPTSEFWISDSEINEMKNRLGKLNKKINTIKDSIQNGTNNFRCLVDLIQFAIRDNHSDLYFRANSTYGECIASVVNSHQLHKDENN